MSDDRTVIPFDLSRPRSHREAPLTDAELAELRAMLAEFAVIKHSCPTARRLLQDG